MAQRKRTSNNIQQDEILQDFLADLNEHSKAVIKLQTDLKYFRETLDLITKLYNGSDNKESLPTRLKVLEDGLTRIQEEVKKAGNDEIDRQILEMNNTLDNLKRSTHDSAETIKTNIDNNNKQIDARFVAQQKSIDKLNEFVELQKASWRKYVIEFIKWSGAIVSAYILFKLTGK